MKTPHEVFMEVQKSEHPRLNNYILPEEYQLKAMQVYADQFQPVTPEQKGVEQWEEKSYHVCHACQKQGLRHCNEADVCTSVKTYPVSLRKMVEIEFENKTPLIIIAEMAFDLGKSLK